MRRILALALIILTLIASTLVSQKGTKNPHGSLKWDCQSCHTPESWTSLKSPLNFDHGETSFPLIGAHKAASCIGCHKDLNFANVEKACAKCHNDVHRGQLGGTCQNCHSSENWQSHKDEFELHAQNGFPLTGVHAMADCEACHQNQKHEELASTPTQCQGCHNDDFAATQNPSHLKAGFSMTCENCHHAGALTWRGADYQHPAAFPLVGGHGKSECVSCHANAYAGTDKSCYGCHQTDFAGSTDPKHVEGTFGHDCETCHGTSGWRPASFKHELTRFQLVGAHAKTECQDCHSKGYTGTSAACYDCHNDKFAATRDPDHVKGNFDHNCSACHSVTDWKPAIFDHNKTKFVLTGAHRSVDCASCHSQGYAGTSTDCYSCHRERYASVKDPNHVNGNYNHDCTQCHSTTNWTTETIDHNATHFPLTGAHLSAACATCHQSGFVGTSTQCDGCHHTSFASVKDPNHVADGFPTQCQICHNTVAWSPATIDHNLTSFALTGAHAAATCVSCHASGYAGTLTACYGCHQDRYASVKDPDHQGQNFDHDCAKCHATNAWKPVNFDHNLTSFALTGAHAAATCVSCHVSGYAGTPTACYGCHQDKYMSMKDPDHVVNNFNHDCTQCHGTTAWKPAHFDHNSTAFVLTGAHVAVTCISCHASGYTGTPISCYSCHQDEFAAIKDPDHINNNFNHDCTQCHTTTAWKPAGFDHNSATFTLTGAHATVACNLCHTTGYAGTATACYGCHQDKFASIKDPDHVLSNFSHDCAPCHTTSAWKPANFDHSVTQFPLTGKHTATACADCHSAGYSGTTTDCYTCHQSSFASAANPNHAQNNFSHDCRGCHNSSAWQPSTFDHGSTAFILTGAHQTAVCIACHAGGYAGTSSACYACHQTEYASVKNPDHVAGNFNHDCKQCHSTVDWTSATFDHAITGFPLIGKHVGVTCQTCHTAGYANTSPACYLCHQSAYAGALNPDHAKSNFDHDCSKCHTTNGWSPAYFDHATTQFQLTGAHTTQACLACHAAGYVNTPKDCYSCHQSAYTGVIDPNHTTNNFSQDCTQCHSMTAWKPATFNHSATQFPLIGAHTSVTCVSCHATGYANTPTDCYSCHIIAYAGVKDPNHATNNFNHDCTQCHSMTAWKPATFNHNQTQFPLTGAHTTQTCVACHATGYANTSKDCYSCHQSAFAGATTPSHSTNNLSHDCTTCHNTVAWQPSTFNHSTTQFPLTGAHISKPCIACHAAGYVITPKDCYSCHQSAFVGATAPNHSTNNFSHDCTTCHNTIAWQPSTFNHSTTQFPLTGAHISKPCIACHAAGYVNTPTACNACHHSDFTGASDPNHVAALFSTVCTTCHTTATWTPSSYNHATTGFALTGKHSTVRCAVCHPSVYAGTSTDCYSCHQAAYTGTTNPNHVAAAFPTTCQNCHTTSGWTPANWNHDSQYFRIYSGTHRGRWNTCADCHVSPTNYAVFECINCHTHAKSTTDSHHTGVKNYQYNSNACFNCHSRV